MVVCVFWCVFVPKTGEPNAQTFTADLNFPDYQDLKDMANGNLPGIVGVYACECVCLRAYVNR